MCEGAGCVNNRPMLAQAMPLGKSMQSHKPRVRAADAAPEQDAPVVPADEEVKVPDVVDQSSSVPDAAEHDTKQLSLPEPQSLLSREQEAMQNLRWMRYMDFVSTSSGLQVGGTIDSNKLGVISNAEMATGIGVSFPAYAPYVYLKDQIYFNFAQKTGIMTNYFGVESRPWKTLRLSAMVRTGKNIGLYYTPGAGMHYSATPDLKLGFSYFGDRKFPIAAYGSMNFSLWERSLFPRQENWFHSANLALAVNGSFLRHLVTDPTAKEALGNLIFGAEYNAFSYWMDGYNRRGEHSVQLFLGDQVPLDKKGNVNLFGRIYAPLFTNQVPLKAGDLPPNYKASQWFQPNVGWQLGLDLNLAAWTKTPVDLQLIYNGKYSDDSQFQNAKFNSHAFFLNLTVGIPPLWPQAPSGTDAIRPPKGFEGSLLDQH